MANWTIITKISDMDKKVTHHVQDSFEKLKVHKQQFFNEIKESQINLQVHYIPIHIQPFYQKKYGLKPGDFPVSENFYRNEVSLPMYPSLSTDDVELVVKSILAIISA